MDNCIFCKIIKGDIPCFKVFETNDVLAFLDAKPHAKGHTVLISKEHGETIYDISSNSYGTLMNEIPQIMKKLKEKLSCDGFNVGWNHLTAGGQVVPHLHLHILPRFNNDGGGSMHSIITNPGEESVEEVGSLFKE